MGADLVGVVRLGERVRPVVLAVDIPSDRDLEVGDAVAGCRGGVARRAMIPKKKISKFNHIPQVGGAVQVNSGS